VTAMEVRPSIPGIDLAKGSTEAASVPFAPAILEIGKDRHFWHWRINTCPICGRSHSHGGGPVGADPRIFLSHRAAHCRDINANGYLLIDAEPSRTVSMLTGGAM